MEYKAGDTVCLKSGGPIMTVRSTNEDTLFCLFFHGGEIKSLSFDKILVNKVKKNSFDWVVDSEVTG